jgi:hypothetical protein
MCDEGSITKLLVVVYSYKETGIIFQNISLQKANIYCKQLEFQLLILYYILLLLLLYYYIIF